MTELELYLKQKEAQLAEGGANRKCDQHTSAAAGVP